MIRRTAAIAAVTWTELVRLKVFYFLIIFGLLVIGNSFFLARFSFEEEFQMLKDIALGAMSIFSSLLAILATATLLPAIARATDAALAVRGADDLGSAAPLLDLFSMRHETQYTRLFRS